MSAAQIEARLYDMGYTPVHPLLGVRTSDSIELQCQYNHQSYTAPLDKVLYGTGSLCPTCTADARLRRGWEVMKGLVEADGYKLLSLPGDYLHSSSKVTVQCPDGHPAYAVLPCNWRSGRRCKVCSIKLRGESRRIPWDRVVASVRATGYTVLSTEADYSGATSYLSLSCPNGHPPYRVLVGNFRNGGNRCPHCPRRKPEAY